jgi:hypothetical protein
MRLFPFTTLPLTTLLASPRFVRHARMSSATCVDQLLAPPAPAACELSVSTAPVDIDQQDAAILFLPAKLATQSAMEGWSLLPYADTLAARTVRRHATANTEQLKGLFLTTELPNAIGTRVTLCAVAEEASRFDLLTLAAKAVSSCLAASPRSLYMLAPWQHGDELERLADAVVAATLAATAPLPLASSDSPPPPPPLALHVAGLPSVDVLRRSLETSHGANLCRYIASLPPNALTPHGMRRFVADLADQEGFDIDELDVPRLRSAGCGAFLAVAEASGDDGGVRGTRDPTLVSLGVICCCCCCCLWEWLRAIASQTPQRACRALRRRRSFGCGTRRPTPTPMPHRSFSSAKASPSTQAA